MLRKALPFVLVALVAARASAQTAAVSTTPTPPPETPPAETPPTPAPTPPPAPDPALIAAIVDQDLAQRDGVVWKDGFKIRSADGASTLALDGYTQFDGRYFVTDDTNTDTFAFKSIRADLTGTLLGRADFRLMPDFAGGKVVVQDAWVDVRTAGGVKLELGKMKEPFGLERLQPETSTLFVERGLPTDLAPNRDLGVQVHGNFSRLEYALGVFNGVADGGSSDGDVSDDKDVAARLFVTPGAGFGFGGAATYGRTLGTATATDLPQLKSSGSATFFQFRTGTTLDDAAIGDGVHWRATGQAYWYRGGFGALAEYVHGNQEVTFGGSPTDVKSDAWQLALDAVVHGSATYKGTVVARAFDPAKHQWGAFEVNARYHELRIGDAAFVTAADPMKSAWRARAFGIGADWHLSKQLRFELNLERTTFRGGAAKGDRAPENAVLGRVQAVF